MILIEHRRFVAPLLASVIMMCSRGAYAGTFAEGDLIMLQVAPTAIHFQSSDEHARYSWLVGIEWQSSSRWLVGAAYFNNSYDQKCEYLYVGKSWPLDSINSHLYFKLSAGLLLGYKEPFDNKIPFNDDGKAISAVPALGYKVGRFNAQVNLLGSAGIMFTFGYDIAR